MYIVCYLSGKNVGGKNNDCSYNCIKKHRKHMQRTQQSYQDNEGLGRGVNKMGARLDRMYLLILF